MIGLVYNRGFTLFYLLGRRPVVFHRLKIRDFLDAKECKDESKEQKVGYNIDVDFDKNSDSLGSSTLHIPNDVHRMMKVYLMKRLRQFDETNLFKEKSLDLDNLFFVTGQGKPFSKTDLSHMNVEHAKVTAFSHRRKVSTWAQNHEDMEIRETESEALQHSKKVAGEHYDLKKALKPQAFVQRYTKEQGMYPKELQSRINEAEERVKEAVDEQEDVGREARKND